MLISNQFISLNLGRLVDDLLELHRGVDLREKEREILEHRNVEKIPSMHKAHISVSKHVVYQPFR